MFPPRPCSPPSQTSAHRNSHHLSALDVADWPQPSEAKLAMHVPCSKAKQKHLVPYDKTFPAGVAQSRERVEENSKHHRLRPSQSKSSLISVAEDNQDGPVTERVSRPSTERLVHNAPSNVAKSTAEKPDAIPARPTVINECSPQPRAIHRPVVNTHSSGKSGRGGPHRRSSRDTLNEGKVDSMSNQPPFGAMGRGMVQVREIEPDKRATSEASRLPSIRPSLVVNSNDRSNAIPPRDVSQSQQPIDKVFDRPPSQLADSSLRSIATIQDTMAEEWEVELTRGAGRLDVSGLSEANNRVQTSQVNNAKTFESSLASGREAQRKQDVEWELSGLQSMNQDTAREAEDRMRRDAGRDIAYPPSMPRIPIRAAPNGFTSIHVGIRPRLHPSRANKTLERNQPDTELSVPLFSPLRTSQANKSLNEFHDTVKGSYNQLYHSSLAEKAKEQYESWLHKKSERESGIAEEQDIYGTMDWVPRTRVVARPGAVEGIAHSDGYGDPALRPQVKAAESARQGSAEKQHHTQWNPYGYPFTYPSFANGAQGDYVGVMDQQNDATTWMVNPMNGPTSVLSQMYPPQGFCDPNAYWWGLGMGIPDDVRPDSFHTEGIDPSAHSAGMDEKKAYFAESRDKTHQLPSYDCQAFLDGNPYTDPDNMTYNPYQQYGNRAGVYGLMQGQYNPYMAMMGQEQMMAQSGGMGGAGMVSPGGLGVHAGEQGGLQPFDSSKMKQGRMGHYGYLEGRELAGPPPGHLPAGMPHQSQAGSSPKTATVYTPATHSHPQSTRQPASSPTSSGFYTNTGMKPVSPAVPRSQSQSQMKSQPKSAWGDPGNASRVRYDGVPTGKKIVQADLDSPYPRTKVGGMASAWTRYGENEELGNIDGRLGATHRRVKAGKV